jgi:predicted site-specific integrase-resolvase
MFGINRLSLVGWTCAAIGLAIVVLQAANGNTSDWLFNVALLLVITGFVLRVYGKFNRGKK